MRKLVIICLFLQGTSYAQTSISLDSCIVWAKRNYPLIQQNQAILHQADQNERAISENWYPKWSFLGQATYNTEVVSFNFPGMNVSFPHDAYLTSLGLEQVVVDGGQTKTQHQIEQLNTELEVQKNEMELYKLVERVNQLYINVLLGRENLNILKLYKEDLESRRKNMSAGVQNGLVLESALNELDAEILKTEQNIIESNFNLKGIYQILTLFINQPVMENTVLQEIPLGGRTAKVDIQRPELKVFDLQSKLLDQRFHLTNVYALPRVTVGAAANYGRPGPNFINQELRFFGSANITVKWNVSSLYGLKRERKKLEIGKNMIEVQRDVFLFNIQATMTTQNAQLEALSGMIEKDQLIIEKRHSVTQTAISQMENGKITVANYLTQLNAELQAKLNKKVHEIRLMNTISTINATAGVVNF